MKDQKIRALAPMLASLRIKQSVSFDECYALFSELQEKAGATVPAGDLSGNQWCALVNLAIARFSNQSAAPVPPVAPVAAPGEPVAWQRRVRSFVTGEWEEWEGDGELGEELDPTWAERRPLYTHPQPAADVVQEEIHGDFIETLNLADMRKEGQ